MPWTSMNSPFRKETAVSQYGGREPEISHRRWYTGSCGLHFLEARVALTI